MKLRYAVVDDAPFIRELIKSAMSRSGHLCVGEAGDGKEALDVVSKTLPDVIFLDLVMPRKNGLSVATEIRDLWPEGKIVICTTMDRYDLPVTAAAPSYDAWLAKPFTQEDLDKILVELFGRGQEAPV